MSKSNNLWCIYKGSRGGAVVELAFASHQCGPGSIPGLGVKCGLSLLLVLVFVPRGFSSGTPIFLSPQKPIHLDMESKGHRFVSRQDYCVPPLLTKPIYFYCTHLNIKAPSKINTLPTQNKKISPLKFRRKCTSVNNFSGLRMDGENKFRLDIYCIISLWLIGYIGKENVA